jgi:hypothetical protein
MITSQQIVRVVDKTRLMRVGLWEFRWPDSIVGVFGLMNSEVRSPHSIVNDSLSVIPLLEVITFVLLMCWVNSWSEDHLWNKFSLLEPLINEQIIFLMHSSVTSLAGTLENFKSTSQTIFNL